MKITHASSAKVATVLSTVAMLSVVLGPLALPSTALAAVLPFTDSFEAPTNLGNWTSGTRWNSDGSQDHTGAKSARVTGSSGTHNMESTISTSGYNTLSMSFWYRADDLESSENDKVEVYYSTNGGSSWTEITTAQIDDNDDDENWHQFTYSSFPAGANDNANFKIRFADDLDGGSDKVWIDDFSFTGTAIPPTLYTITASAGAGGSITPSGAVSVVSGASQAFSIVANAFYHIVDVLVDSATQGAIGAYTFTNVLANHTISASFAQNTENDAETCSDEQDNDGDEQIDLDDEDCAPFIPEPTTGSIEITKYSCTEGTTVTRSANGVGLSVPETCTPESGATFGYVHGEQEDANGPYPELSADITEAGSTNGSGVLTIGELSPAGRYLVVETDGSGNQLPYPDSKVLGLYCTGDGDTSDNNDNQELTFVTAGETVQCVAYDKAPVEPKSCTIVSDTTTLSDGNPSAILSFIHSAWATISGASWIWGTDPVADPTTDTTQVFTKVIALDSVPTSASIELAADNGYTLKVNGVTVDDQIAVENNYNPTHVIPVTNLVAGNNTIEVTVKNFAMEDAPATDNPAGLIFKLTVDGSDCTEVTPPDPEYVKVHILKYLWNGESIVAVDPDSGAPSFPMHATWYAENIGSGEGNYSLGLTGHGGSGPYAADTSPMQVPADYSTEEVPDNTTVLPAQAECESGKYRFVGYRTGSTLGDAISAETTSSSPVYSDLMSDRYVIVINEKCPETSTVTICKYDDSENSLSGWNLFLKGSYVESLAVDSGNISGTNSGSLFAGISYLATVAGTWTNQGGANPVDAEYSTTDSWSTNMDGYDGYGVGILELEINETDGNWGPYNSAHQYAQSFTPGSTGPINFRIFDGDTNSHSQTAGWFGDNSGILPVDIFEGYAGITGENGCVTFENVQYGTYEVGETSQDGWTNVSGLGEVTVDESTETFDIVNTTEESEEQEQPTDVCSNIAGLQTSVPTGYHPFAGQCIKNGGDSETTTVTDAPPQVLGASTEGEPEPEVLGESCGLYMDKFLRRGHADNNADQVKKLQEFLNKWMNSGLPTTGFFGPLTENAVKAFQGKYSDEVLKPWNIPGPTGLVYLTTLRQINLLECPDLGLQIPALVPWSGN